MMPRDLTLGVDERASYIVWVEGEDLPYNANRVDVVGNYLRLERVKFDRYNRGQDGNMGDESCADFVLIPATKKVIIDIEVEGR